MDDLLWIIFGVCFFGGLSAFTIFCFVMAFKQYKQHKASKSKGIYASKENTIIEPEFTTMEVKAMVVDQSCCVKMVGIKTPKAVKEFTVVFETDDGEILKLDVAEEMYDGFNKGQKGLLTIVDGDLYGFALDESSTENE